MSNAAKKMERATAIKNVRLGATAVTDLAQRRRSEGRIAHLLSNFDLDQIGLPVVNKRDGLYYIIDGQHRVEALKRFLGKDWEKCEIPCRCYDGLSLTEEAEMFLRYNDVLPVRMFDKFKAAVTAGRPDEVKVYRIVEKEGLKISEGKTQGCISCVSALMKVYERGGEEVLARTLRIIRDVFGDAGFEARVVDGVSLFCHRYAGVLDEKHAVESIAELRGGIHGLQNRAAQLRLRTGSSVATCTAAVMVEIYNGRKGAKRLASWWKTDESMPEA